MLAKSAPFEYARAASLDELAPREPPRRNECLEETHFAMVAAVGLAAAAAIGRYERRAG